MNVFEHEQTYSRLDNGARKLNEQKKKVSIPCEEIITGIIHSFEDNILIVNNEKFIIPKQLIFDFKVGEEISFKIFNNFLFKYVIQHITKIF